jgi:hypothetical protein
MRIGLHRPAEGLLAENGKRIRVINENPTIDTRFYRETPNKFCYGFTNAMNSTVLVGTNLEAPVWILKLNSATGEIVF